jgi:hypothetical protein
MRTWVMAAVVAAVLLVVGLPVVAVALGAGSDGAVAQAFAAGPTATADEDDQTEGDGQRGAKVKDHDARGHRHGPPSWAQGHGANGHEEKKPGKAALEAWKRLTPAQKAKRMAELARVHADGMERWADCVAAGRTDCERPLPPGLAKREVR